MPTEFKPAAAPIGLHGIPPIRPRAILRRLVALWAIAVVLALLGLLAVAEGLTGLLEAMAGTPDEEAAVFYLAEARASLCDWLAGMFE